MTTATPGPPAGTGGARPATSLRPLPPLAAVIAYTLRSCVPSRRALLILPALGGVVFGLLSRTSTEPPAEAFALVGGSALHGLVLPITCLVIGDAILGAELRSGTFAFTWLSPLPFSTIVAGRWAGGWAIAIAVIAPGAALAAIAAGVPGSAGPAVLASVAGAGAYLALFLAIGAAFRRPVVWSLALVILVERLLGAALSGIAQLSPGWLAQAVLVGLTDTSEDLHRNGVPHGWGGVARLAMVAAFGLVIARYRLGHIRPSSATD